MKKLLALLLTLALVFSALALTACGGDGNESETSAATETESATDTESATEQNSESETGSPTPLPTVAEVLAALMTRMDEVTRLKNTTNMGMTIPGAEMLGGSYMNSVLELINDDENPAFHMTLDTNMIFAPMTSNSIFVDGVLYTSVSMMGENTKIKEATSFEEAMASSSTDGVIDPAFFVDATIEERDGKYVLSCDEIPEELMEGLGIEPGMEVVISKCELVVEKDGFLSSATMNFSVMEDSMGCIVTLTTAYETLPDDFVISAPADADEYEEATAPSGNDPVLVLNTMSATMNEVDYWTSTVRMDINMDAGDVPTPIAYGSGTFEYVKDGDSFRSRAYSEDTMSGSLLTETQIYADGVLYELTDDGDNVTKTRRAIDPGIADVMVDNPLSTFPYLFMNAEVIETEDTLILSLNELPDYVLEGLIGELPGGMEPEDVTVECCQLFIRNDGFWEGMALSVTINGVIDLTLCLDNTIPETAPVIAAPADAEEYREID